jgi:hypothetical protein
VEAGVSAPRGAWALVLALGLGVPTRATADVVDDAYAAGTAAALDGRWPDAIAHYERALSHLPGHSAALEHDLGLAYAHAGELGRATYHLQRALSPAADPSPEVEASARRTLGVVRRRVELAAEAAGDRVAPDVGWTDVLAATFASATFGAVVLAAGLLALVGAATWLRGRAKVRRGGAAWLLALALAAAASFVIGAPLHEISARQATTEPTAIVLPNTAEVFDGPSARGPAAFRLHGGSRVRLMERNGAWRRLRTADGLSGWVRAEAVGALDGA